MNDSVARFLVSNLGASLLAGLWAAAVVLGIIHFFGLSRAVTRNRLWAVPAIKSTLVLLGLCTVMPAPAETWRRVHESAVGFDQVAPFALVILGAAVLLSPVLRTRLEARLLALAEPVPVGDRVSTLLTRVMAGFNEKHPAIGGFEVSARVPRPEVFRCRARSSVAILDGEQPVLLLPASFDDRLDDEELEGVLAHEVAHLALGRPRGCCDPAWLKRAGWINPTAWFVSRRMAQEEELACDELAARVTGNPEALASGILKAYRYGTGEPRRAAEALTAELVKSGGLLKQRVRRLTDGSLEDRESPARVCAAWALALLLVFAAV